MATQSQSFEWCHHFPSQIPLDQRSRRDLFALPVHLSGRLWQLLDHCSSSHAECCKIEGTQCHRAKDSGMKVLGSFSAVIWHVTEAGTIFGS